MGGSARTPCRGIQHCPALRGDPAGAGQHPAATGADTARAHRHARTPSDDDVPFNFQNKDKIKRLYVSPDTHKLISAGKLVIVNDNGVFELVPPAIAEKIRARNPSLVIDLPSDEEPSADDPYADYQVPDDLIW